MDHAEVRVLAIRIPLTVESSRAPPSPCRSTEVAFLDEYGHEEEGRDEGGLTAEQRLDIARLRPLAGGGGKRALRKELESSW